MHASTALEVLVDMMNDPKVKAAERRAAANDILNRGYGTPRQPAPAKRLGKQTAVGLTTEQLLQMVKQIQNSTASGKREPVVLEGEIIPRRAAPAPDPATDMDDLLS